MPFCEFSLCLSRACLGKHLAFSTIFLAGGIVGRGPDLPTVRDRHPKLTTPPDSDGTLWVVLLHLKDVMHRHCLERVLRKQVDLFSFSYSCPEPVLVIDRFIMYQMAQKGVFRTAASNQLLRSTSDGQRSLA
eukprot:COSAG06_NODE_18007_length_908_cov_0.738272_2_plen_131_part_01